MSKKELQRNVAARNLTVLGLLAAPWVGFLAVALRPSPRQMWAQKWPTIAFVGMYQIALDRCVEIEGLDNLPTSGPVILAGNHINKSAMDAMLMGSKILIERGGLAKFVSQADNADPVLKRFIKMLGNTEGVILPIAKGSTTRSMIHFLQNPETFKRQQPILGIFPAGSADDDFMKQMNRPWHTSAAVAAFETGVPIVPFYVEGLPLHWGPMDMLKAVGRSVVGGTAFSFKARFGKPIHPEGIQGERRYTEMTEQLRQAVFQLAAEAKKANT